MKTNKINSNPSNQSNVSKLSRIQLLRKILKEKPQSRRMAATALGYTDQSFMVTNQVKKMLETGIAEVYGIIKCERSGEIVEGITTNPDLFKSKKRKSNNEGQED